MNLGRFPDVNFWKELLFAYSMYFSVYGISGRKCGNRNYSIKCIRPKIYFFIFLVANFRIALKNYKWNLPLKKKY